MRIDVQALREGDTVLEIRESASALDLTHLPAEFKSEVTVDLRVHRKNDEIVVRATARGLLVEECSRCLVPYEREFRVEFGIFCDKMKASRERQIEEIEGETYSVPHDGRTLEIAPCVREAMVLSLPMRPLCQENCRGLCPSCGANLNEMKCTCETGSADSRWSLLETLNNKKKREAKDREEKKDKREKKKEKDRNEEKEEED